MNKILIGDALDQLRQLPDESVQCCVTSPPYYGLRDYGHAGQIGLEQTPEEYIANLVSVFREVKRVLRSDGTLWLNLGDSYAGSGKGPPGNLNKEYHHLEGKSGFNTPEGLKPKDLMGIPWRVALALQADGWWLRSDIIWHKPNPMPESVTDRPTRSHEYIFLLSKSAKYYYDHEAIKEPITDSSILRLGQNVEAQAGSLRANGGAKTNGPMKAVRFGGDKKNGGNTYSGKAWRPNGVERSRELGYDSKENEIRKHRSSGRFKSEQEMKEHYKNLRDDGQKPPTRNKRDVWTVTTQPYKGAHFAVFPEALITPCIMAGSPVNNIVLDPFAGSGTTLYVAKKHHRQYIGIELNEQYLPLIEERLSSLDLPIAPEPDQMKMTF